MVSFPTGTVTAPAGQWAIPYAGFALLWILILWALRRRELKNPWLLPLLLAWTSFAAWLGMQYLAAPAVVVQPVGLDRFLWPAGLALAQAPNRNTASLPPCAVESLSLGLIFSTGWLWRPMIEWTVDGRCAHDADVICRWRRTMMGRRTH